MQGLTPPDLVTPGDHVPSQRGRVLRTRLEYELAVRLPIEPHQIVHVLQFGFVCHIGWDATKSGGSRSDRRISSAAK